MFKLTKQGRCDATLSYYNDSMEILYQHGITFDMKPTIKDLKSMFKIEGAKYLRISTTPAWVQKTFKL
jgi:hypothetical protein